MLKPKSIREGSKLGLIAPARFAQPHLLDDMLNKCVGAVKSLGYRAVLGKHVREYLGYYAGSDENRAADVMAMYQDDDIDAIWCLNGGYGAERLFPYLDFEIISRNPKLLIGHSNICHLHYMIHKLAYPWTINWLTAVNLSDLATWAGDQRILQVFRKIAGGADAPWEYPLRGLLPPVTTLVPGRVRATLTGGFLLNQTTGTPWQIDTHNRIVVMELGREMGFWLDFVPHLHNAGMLQDAAGFIVSITEFPNLPERPAWALLESEKRTTPNGHQTLRGLLEDYLLPLEKPTLLNVPFEHAKGAFPMPYGALVEMDAGEKRITVLENIFDDNADRA